MRPSCPICAVCRGGLTHSLPVNDTNSHYVLRSWCSPSAASARLPPRLCVSHLSIRPSFDRLDRREGPAHGPSLPSSEPAAPTAPDAPDEVPFSFPSAGRARTVGNVITDWTYEYVSTGLNTGILTMAVDTTSEGYVIITQLTFTTTTSGTFTFSADNGETRARETSESSMRRPSAVRFAVGGTLYSSGNEGRFLCYTEKLARRDRWCCAGWLPGCEATKGSSTH